MVETNGTTPQHTPTPWTWETWDGDERVFIYTGDSTTGLQPQPIILRGPDKITNVERAKQIVSDHNTHAALVEALEEVRDLIDPPAPKGARGPVKDLRLEPWAERAVETINRALAAAKGTR